MQEPLDIPAAWAVLRRRGWIVLVSIAVALAAAVWVTSHEQRRYQADATLFVSGVAPDVRGASSDPVGASVQLATLAQASALAYAQLASSLAVADNAAAALHVPLDQVVGHIQGQATPGVQLIHLTADATTGVGAARLADAAAIALATHAPGLANRRSGGIRLEIADPAQVPGQPVSPKLPLNLMLAGVAGLLLGLALATVRERLDRRIRSAADVRESLGLPVLGELPPIPRRLRRRSALERQAVPRIADPYFNLAAAISVATNGEQRRLLITSPSTRDGKSTIAAHLALSLTKDGESTVLLEGDLHRPSQRHAFPQPLRRPLTELLLATNGMLPQDAEVVPGLKVMAVTEAEADHALTVRSPEYLHGLDSAPNGHDRVVIDAPPILGPADTGVLARRADAALLVLRAGQTREDSALEALAALNRLGIPVLGIVLSRVRGAPSSDYYLAHR